MKPSFVTTPIYYINARPHIGHAYTTMLADAVARSRRLLGDDVFFMTGTDEHGQKVERAAQKAGMKTEMFAEQTAAHFRQMSRDLNISNDDFIRTTEPRHHRAAQEIWRRVAANGDIYKGEYEGWYCTVDEVFVPETQLLDGKCPTCGGKVERLKEESYYFRLSKYQQPLLDFYAANPDFLQPAFRLNEVRTFVEAGLQDLSISRTSFSWGVPVPDDPKHVMYVWFDALTNYLTVLGFGSGDDSRVQRFWPTVTHLVGKEIVRQHALYWPAFLMSAGLPPPHRIVAHGWWLMGGAKMSKSAGNVARYQDYVSVFGVDALRYFVMREMPLGGDANFSDEGILTRFNADLANDLGNLVSRATTMVQRYCGGVVPESNPARRDDLDAGLVARIDQAIGAVVRQFDAIQITGALQDAWELIRAVNQYIVKREPWALAKKPEQRATLEATLYHAADALRVTAALIDPVMPGAAERIRRMLGIQQEPWTALKAGTLAPGTRLGTIEPLFPRIEKTLEELRAMADTETPPPDQTPAAQPGALASPVAPPVVAGAAALPPPGPPSASAPGATADKKGGHDEGDVRLSIDEFMKVELRVAKVLEAESVPKSKKLIKMRVDVGTEQRTIVAGIAEAYQPDQLIGRTIVIVANLKPAKLMGIESNGMVLAASVEGGAPTLLSVDPSMPPGTRVR
ncbi:MAG TPA: methionine--tRNA ligase [Vicinamibacterales bacterium]|nr:methionine--tRNA ligase [Vicinamibacterales bacterium]